MAKRESKIAKGVVKAYVSIENAVVGSYKAVETATVDAYKRVEDTAVRIGRSLAEEYDRQKGEPKNEE